MATSARIGIVEWNGNGWTGGTHFMRMLMQALSRSGRERGSEVFVLRDTAANSGFPTTPDAPYEILPVETSHYFRGEKLLRRLLRLPDKSGLLATARANHIDVLLPLLSVPRAASETKFIGWIPDFQHVHLPEYFGESERRERDAGFWQVAERARLVLLTSQDVRKDFVAFAPAYAHKARVVSFPAFLATEMMAADPRATARRFHIPEKFALVANQFWRHKNHSVVIEAIARLRQNGLRIPLVLTGLPADYRDPANRVLSHTLQEIARAGLRDQVTMLGLVADDELIDLMRVAAVIIQPSRFEGWSMIVQSAKALGRPLLCSDIAVHREQAPAALGFFPCESADALAELLAARWPNFVPGPDLTVEQRALAGEREFVRQYGQALLNLCLEACSL